jgi:P pilus assembly chaperone PapD
MKPKYIYRLVCLAAGIWFVGSATAQTVSGLQPESPVLLVSETQGEAQMGVKNSDAENLLLHTNVYDVDGDTKLEVIPLPPIIRVDAGGRQLVRFVLENTGEPLKVQHYKRVTFEGIPEKSTKTTESRVRVNVRYDLPVIISPKGLVLNETPWDLMVWRVEENKLVVTNPSPYVVRMSRQVDLLPALTRVEIAQRTFILPGETLSLDLPAGTTAKSIHGVRLFPATLYGYTAPDYDAPLKP